jgi:16S rRNA (cytidine1402-2'-O)-methyltransferase
MLYIVATPIGNLEDMSPRGLEVLRSAAVVACEDTRRTRVLLTHFNIPHPRVLISYRQGNEEHMGEVLVRHLDAGETVALCSDGGYPGVSDPGYRLAALAAERGLPFSVIPGPSAVLTALVASGLPTSSFTFKGYPPRKGGALHRFFAEEADRPHTLIVFESPFRVTATLAAAREVLGDRRAAVCLELTKKFERVCRGYLTDLEAEFARKPAKGEITVVVAGNHPKFRRGGGGLAPDGGFEGVPESGPERVQAGDSEEPGPDFGEEPA